MENYKQKIDEYNEQLEGKSAKEILSFFDTLLGKDLVLASSLGAEDQVLTQLFTSITKDARVFVLDTGRLHQETYDVMDKSRRKYRLTYEVYFPLSESVQEMVATNGPNLFYDSIESRKLCCGIRKVEPLGRALKTCKAWITGLRREQAVTRKSLPIVEWDDGHQLLKINPLATWTEEDIWSYIKDNLIPYNDLHDKGFPSIGCAPCTRAIEKGEDVRAGRWWWESPELKECGLHVKDGKLIRKRES
ncbi:phosphoadenylyl-sulfate reductase [bacterium]|jgi:phosphoadenosine phosphosulfate reductase|nr:phosphoadenylyl-sulfate reductase [bacterium]